MNTTTNAPTFGPDDLPNDPILLRERIERQNSLLGYQLLEIDVLRDEVRELKQRNQRLRLLIWPVN
jgi:cell shape-determining protein MreC